jgi:hypothetical protein
VTPYSDVVRYQISGRSCPLIDGTRPRDQEDHGLNIHRRKTLKSHIIKSYSQDSKTYTYIETCALNKHHAMKAYLGWRYSSTHSLTSALDRGEWSASRPCRFTPRESAPGTHWRGGWVGPRVVLDAIFLSTFHAVVLESKGIRYAKYKMENKV